jgi:hypothetical protein
MGDPDAKYVFIYYHGMLGSRSLHILAMFTVLQGVGMLSMETIPI